MGEDQTKSDDARFEESLRQILDGNPSGVRQVTAGNSSAGPRAHPESGVGESAGKIEEAEGKALFWFKLIRMLALPALLALLAMFVLRITAAR